MRVSGVSGLRGEATVSTHMVFSHHFIYWQFSMVSGGRGEVGWRGGGGGGDVVYLVPEGPIEFEATEEIWCDRLHPTPFLSLLWLRPAAGRIHLPIVKEKQISNKWTEVQYKQFLYYAI